MITVTTDFGRDTREVSEAEWYVRFVAPSLRPPGRAANAWYNLDIRQRQDRMQTAAVQERPLAVSAACSEASYLREQISNTPHERGLWACRRSM